MENSYQLQEVWNLIVQNYKTYKRRGLDNQRLHISADVPGACRAPHPSCWDRPSVFGRSSWLSKFKLLKCFRKYIYNRAIVKPNHSPNCQHRPNSLWNNWARKAANTWFRVTIWFLQWKIIDFISEIVIQQCYGCSVDYPSQAQHSCIIETPLTHLWMHFDIAVGKVPKETVIMEKWRKEIATLNIPDSINIDNNELISSKLIERHNPDTEFWRQEITKICENMVKFKSRYLGCFYMNLFEVYDL